MNSVMRFVLALTLIIGASELECSEFDGSSHECESGLVSLKEKLAEWTLDCDVGLPKTTISGFYSVC